MRRRRWLAVFGGVTLGVVASFSIGIAVNTQLSLSSRAQHSVTYLVLNPSNGRAIVSSSGVTSKHTVVLDPITGEVVSISH